MPCSVIRRRHDSFVKPFEARWVELAPHCKDVDFEVKVLFGVCFSPFHTHTPFEK